MISIITIPNTIFLYKTLDVNADLLRDLPTRLNNQVVRKPGNNDYLETFTYPRMVLICKVVSSVSTSRSRKFML